jgi:hypothetical protein
VLAVQKAEVQRYIAYSWSVDEGEHFFDMFVNEPIKENFVAVLQGGEKKVFGKIISPFLEILIAPLDLLHECGDVEGKQAVQPKCVPLPGGKGCAFIVEGVIEDLFGL